MRQDEIIEMANKAGCISYTKPHIRAVAGVSMTFAQLEAFAKLVAAKATDEANARANASWTLMCKKMVDAEREACAKMCDEYSAVEKIEEFDRGWLTCAKNIALAIRARGKA